MRIETCFSRSGLDGRGIAPANRLARSSGSPVEVTVVDVVLLDFALPLTTAIELFCDPIVQFVAEVPAPELEKLSSWSWLVELAFRPGVTDTLALTAREAIEIAGAMPAGFSVAPLVQTARLYVVKAPNATKADVEAAFAPLWNPLVQSATSFRGTNGTEAPGCPIPTRPSPSPTIPSLPSSICPVGRPRPRRVLGQAPSGVEPRGDARGESLFLVPRGEARANRISASPHPPPTSRSR